jgi:hypothetical protein
VLFAALAGALPAAAAVVLVAAAASTGLERHRGGAAASGAPAWAASCYEHEPRPDRQLLERCVRATGVVVRVLERGEGDTYEVHFAIVGRFGAMLVKLEEPTAPEVPDLGARVRVAGALVRARNGMREVQTWAVG